MRWKRNKQPSDYNAADRRGLRMLAMIGGYLLGACAIGVGKIMWHSAMTPTYQLAMEDELKARGATDRVAEWFRLHAPGTSEATDSGAALAFRGIKRISNSDMDLRARLLTQLLAQMDTLDCADIALGRHTRPLAGSMQAAIEKLSSDDQYQWGRISARAMIAEIDGVNEGSPSDTATDDDVATALLFEAHRLAPPDSARYMRTLAVFKDATDANACWLTQEIYRIAPSLPDDIRDKFLRRMAGS